MSADPGPGQRPAGGQTGEIGSHAVDARGATGVQVGPDNTQIIYNYGKLTWADEDALPPLVSIRGKVDSPYRGLRAFEEQDAPFFFGRETATTDVLARMSGCVDRTGLLVVSGVSGAGKSSLLRAGVLPRIRGAGLTAAPEAARWPCLLLTPGPAPLDVLAVQVAHLAGVDAAAVRRGLRRRSGQVCPHRTPGSPGTGGVCGWSGRPVRGTAAAAAVAGGRPVRAGVYPVPGREAAPGVHHRSVRNRGQGRPGTGFSGFDRARAGLTEMVGTQMG